MKKYVVCVVGVLLLFASRLRADTTVSDGLPSSFQTAVSNTVAAGGGTITVTTPIVINSTNGDQTFDGVSNVVVSGGGTSSIFLVQDAGLVIANFTIKSGVGSTNGGAIFVSPEGTLTATNCIFANNTVVGTNGTSFLSDTNDDGGDDSTKTPPTGRNGGRGSSAQSAFGGAVFNLGDASFFTCQFLTNTATGGTGGAGEDGVDGANRGGDGGGGGSGGAAFGGAIFNGGSVLLADSTFAGNIAQGGAGGAGGAAGSGFRNGAVGGGGLAGIAAGAGVYSTNADAAVVVLNCTFNNNIAQGGDGSDGGVNGSGIGSAGRPGGNAFGGGINNASTGSVTMTNSTFFENNALGGTGGNGGNGGGRAGNGGNGGGAVGGGIYSAGTVTIVNCTFSKSAATGGTNGAAGSGIAAGRDGRRGSSQGGNIANVAKGKKGSFTLVNSIIGTGLAGGAASGKFVDGGFNICADRTIKFNKKSTSKANLNPLVGDLAAHGGPTETIAFPTNSPAVDLIPPDLAPATDQRGTNRPIAVFRDFSDAGAFELDPNAITIIQQPQDTNTFVGSNAVFTVVAQSGQQLFYQWYFNPTNVTIDPTNLLVGQTSSTLLITNVQLTNQGQYQVQITNATSSIASRVATLTATTITNSAPVITNQPQSVTVVVSNTASFTVGATGTAPLFYQWVFQVSSSVFTNIPNATNATFSITNVQLTNDRQSFAVTVSNAFGFTNSTIATLFVTTNSSTTDTNTGPPGPPSPFAVSTDEGIQQQSVLMPLSAERDSSGPAAMNFTFSSETGSTYVIEYKKSLADPYWVPISTNNGTGDPLTNRVWINQSSGFYRARRR